MRDDMEFNIKFCEIIEQYPAIYDYTNAEYCNRSVQDKIWAEIGLKTGATDKHCKERWKNIRSCYSKYKKKLKPPSGSAKKTTKEYYLAQHLHFIDNFLKSRPPKSNLNSTVEAYTDGNDDEDDPRSMSGSPAGAVAEIVTPRSTATPSLRNKSPQVTLKDINLMAAEANKSVYEYFKQRNTALKTKDRTEDDSDADMAFFRSMLPDIKSMTHAQKRKFKIGVLNLTEQILKDPYPTFNSYSRISMRSESPYQSTPTENDSPTHVRSYESQESEQTQLSGAYGSPIPQETQSSRGFGGLVPQQTQSSCVSESDAYGGSLFQQTQTSGPCGSPAPQQTQTSGPYGGPAPQQSQISRPYGGPAPQQTQISGPYGGPAPQQTQTSGRYEDPAPQQTQTSGPYRVPEPQQSQTSGSYAGPAPQQTQSSLYLPIFSPVTPFTQSYNLED